MPPRPSLLQQFRFAARRNPPSHFHFHRYFSTPRSKISLEKVRLRLSRLNDSLPPLLRKYTTPLLEAPSAHIMSFVLLHELTAIVPMLGLWADFHYNGRLPDLTSNASFQEKTQKLGNYLRKKGWVEDADVDSANSAVADARGRESDGFEGSASGEGVVGGDNEGKGVRLILEVAAAYTIVKALMPLRVVVSVWATPWFARTVLVPTETWFMKTLRRK